MKRKKGVYLLLLLLVTVLQTTSGNPSSSRKQLGDDIFNDDNIVSTTDSKTTNKEDITYDKLKAILEEEEEGKVNKEEAPLNINGEYSIDSDLIEGDIKATPQQAAMFKKGGWDAIASSQAWYPNHGKWSRTIPYVIDDDIYDHVRNAIKYSIGLFHRYTCLRFVHKQEHHRDYLNFVNKRGCWSHVGRKGGRQEVSLARGCFSAVPAHEISHALGRFHEQSRPDRNRFVEIRKENIKRRTLSNFRIQSNADTQHIPYDYGSVMHYSSYAFTRNRRPTIVPKRRGFILGQRGTISPSDVLHINIRYCPEKMIRLVEGTNPSEGRVEVNWKGQWGTVCDDSFDISDGHAICRYLGYPKALRVFKKGEFGKGRGPIWFDDMKCVGNEYSPFSCNMNKIGSHNCKHNEDVGVTCQNNVRLVKSISNSQGTTSNSGRVEVYFRGKWGTICHDSSFDKTAANVICRQLGKTSARRVYSMAGIQEEGEEKFMRRKVWLSGIRCNGSERQIGFCQYEPLGDLKGACNDDVALHCH